MRLHRLLGAVLVGLSLACAGAVSAQTSTAPAATSAPATAPAPKPAPKSPPPSKSPSATKTNTPKAKPKTDAAAPGVAAAPAAATAPRKVSKGESQALQWFQMLDSDGDGRVSRKEAEVGFRLRPSLKKDFEEADLNGDGYLTQDEIRTVAERRRAERQARRERERAAAARDGGSVKAE